MGFECILESIVLSLSPSGSCLGGDRSADRSDRLVSIRLLLTIADEVGFYSALLSLAHGSHLSQCLYSIYELALTCLEIEIKRRGCGKVRRGVRRM